jgi:PAS domain S-box-containing protein
MYSDRHGKLLLAMPTRDAEILRKLLEVSHSGLLIIDQSGKVLFANPSAHQILGWRKQKTRYLLAADEGKLFTSHSLDEPLGFHPVARALDQNTPLHECELTWKRPQSRAKQLSFNILPLSEAGIVQGAVVSVKDISLSVSEEKWRRHLLRVAGHELRNPLASIMALTETVELLDRPEDSERRQQYIDKIRHKIRATARLLNDFLDATRVRSGYLQFRDEPHDLDKLIQQFVADFQLSNPTHWISIHGSTKSQILIDPVRLNQVLENLLSNAVKNSRSGSEIHVQLHAPQTKKIKKAMIEIRDHGDGIPRSELHKIFDMYYQVKKYKQQPPGMGIGLFLVQKILSHYKTKAQVDSIEGEGTTIRFMLPVIG